MFLAGDRAYKLKRAVKYPYLDFSTPEHRRVACEAELTLNGRTAPKLYLEVRALAHMPDGKVGFATDGPAVDWLVVMRRFDQTLLFDALAKTGRLSAQLMNELAGHIGDFHVMAERRLDYGGAAAGRDCGDQRFASICRASSRRRLGLSSSSGARGADRSRAKHGMRLGREALIRK